jgi:hypothetical protein
LWHVTPKRFRALIVVIAAIGDGEDIWTPVMVHPPTAGGGDGQGNCAEVADDLRGVVPVHDSKRPTGLVLAFSHHVWSAFLNHLR